MKDKIFQSQICVCAASTNLICAKGSAEMREIMGFTMIVLLVYFILFLTDIVAFIYGAKKKKWILFILITVIMVLGIVTLGYLWVTSPM